MAKDYLSSNLSNAQVFSFREVLSLSSVIIYMAVVFLSSILFHVDLLLFEVLLLLIEERRVKGMRSHQL